MINLKNTEDEIMWKTELIKNKLVAVALLVLSIIPIIVDHDGTILIFTGVIAFGLFFSKENWVS